MTCIIVKKLSMFFLSPGSNTNSKDTWDHMTRGFSNALRRKNKRSGSGAADNDKVWKFEKDMEFLLPVKQVRNTSGNMVGIDVPFMSVRYEDSQERQESSNHSVTQQEDGYSDATVDITNELIDDTMPHPPQGQKKQKVGRPRPTPEVDADDTKDIIALIKQRQENKSSDSPRLNFFRSLMPTIDSFDEDQFMKLQIDIIQAVQKQKNSVNYDINRPASSSSVTSMDSYYTQQTVNENVQKFCYY